MQTAPLAQEMFSPAKATGDVVGRTIALTAPQRERRRALVVPREHGAWGMLLVPLVTGAAVGILSGGRFAPVLSLATTVLSLFWLRTPLESWLGTGAVRVQTPEEGQLARRVVFPLTTVALAGVTALLWREKNRELIWLGLIAGAVFGAQLILKQMGRSTRVAAEVVGALALTSTAPSAYCVALGRFDTTALVLWLLNWLFAADQIHFVWLQIRGARAAGLGEKFRLGWSFLVAQILLIWTLALACHLRWLPEFIWIAFTPVLFRGFMWFAKRPRPIVVSHLGWTEMAHAVVFGALLTASFFVVP